MDGLNTLLIGIYCLFGWGVVLLAITFIWGWINLLRMAGRLLDREQQIQLRSPLRVCGLSSIVILIMALLFAYQSITTFFGAFPRP